MINLIPTEMRVDRKYGRLNIFMVRQVAGILTIGLLSVGFMLSGIHLVKTDENVLSESIAEKKIVYDQLKPAEAAASALNKDVRTIQSLYEQEVRFSRLLVDIAGSLPVGVTLTSLSLTGTNTEPIQIAAIITSQELAPVLNKTLVDSGIFESADILNISAGEEDQNGNPENWNVSISASLTGSAEAAKAKAAAEAAAAKAAAEAAKETSEGEQ